MIISRVGTLSRRLASAMTNTIYPSTCAGCGQRGVWLCDLCALDDTPLLLGSCCDRCGHPVIHGRCACRSMHPAIIRARAATVYDGWIARAIRLMKYDRERDRAQFLAAQLLPAFASLGSVDAIIPVPLHPGRLEWRGFNQAELLANHLGRATGVPVELGLERIRMTTTQTHSSRDERIANMEGAFTLRPGWRPAAGAHYVLLDDVYTTGATLGACVEVLDAAGASSISVVTLAFDLQRRDLEEYKRLVSALAT